MKLIKPALLVALLVVSVGYASAATLSVSPANVAQGGTVTATWNAIAAPTNREWIGLYATGAGDTTFSDWIYVNTCSRSGGASVLANGACPFPIPSSLTNGSYQLRLFANNGYTRLATSNTLNVSPVVLPSTRFVDNRDGTISDTQTGLMWEKKSGTVGIVVICNTPTTCTNPHSVNNVYQWSSTGTIPDGALFTDFLTKINRADGVSSDGLTQDRKNYSDWRIPTIAELRGILLASCPGGASPCIDPVFGPAVPAFYWSSTTNGPDGAWVGNLNIGEAGRLAKTVDAFARAVRGGR